MSESTSGPPRRGKPFERGNPGRAACMAVSTPAPIRSGTRPALRLSSGTAPGVWQVQFDSAEALRESEQQLAETFASSSRDFRDRMLVELANLCPTAGGDGADASVMQGHLNSALAVVAAVAPRDELETLLAIQMVAAHTLNMQASIRALQATSIEARAGHGALATKAARTFAAQIEALAKLRNGGRQTVTVIHEDRRAYIAPGAQAIVGNVHTGAGGGGRRGKCRQSDQPGDFAVAGDAVESSAQVWGEDAGWRTVPAPGDTGQEALQAPRRDQSGRAARTSERQLSARPQDEGGGGGAPASAGTGEVASRAQSVSGGRRRDAPSQKSSGANMLSKTSGEALASGMAQMFLRPFGDGKVWTSQDGGRNWRTAG